MPNYGRFNFTGFSGVNLKNTAAVRFEAGNVASTLSVPTSNEQVARAWSLPDKSGRFPISGTFAIQLPAIAATTFFQSTIATVSGIRAEDGLTVSMQGGVSAGYGTASTARILHSAVPGNGNITLTFVNIGAATGYVELIAAYTAVR